MSLFWFLVCVIGGGALVLAASIVASIVLRLEGEIDDGKDE